MNHEIPFVCPVCGEEYDAHLHWHICPKCGTDADREIVAEKRYAIANFATHIKELSVPPSIREARCRQRKSIKTKIYGTTLFP